LKTLSILGSTGSIGVNTLEVVAAFPDKYQVAALGAGRNIELLQQQIEFFCPQIAAVIFEHDAQLLRQRLGNNPVEIVHGVEGMIRCATFAKSEMLVAAVVGAAGLVPTMAAIKAGKDIALANKETLVMAGELVMAEVAKNGVKLLPVDSEHSAIFQSLSGQRSEDVRRLILTASGGPFRDLGVDKFTQIAPADALAHPNWDMGRKISIDSATMMNKGLEVIEACWLFGVPERLIDVVIHPQSIVHSMVEYRDGSVMAQLGIPDMKTPIAYALSWPERLPLPQPALDLCQIAQLSFSAPDMERFPCLPLAFKALAQGGTLPAVLNAANEVAVEAFLNEQLGFVQIPQLIEQVMDVHQPEALTSIDQVLQADLWARREARKMMQGGFK
jgi:1-deoxy-D-xylulose-5-phosphate reductoisomerase